MIETVGKISAIELKELRETRLHLTQHKMAELLDVDYGRYKNWEYRGGPPDSVADKILTLVSKASPVFSPVSEESPNRPSSVYYTEDQKYEDSATEPMRLALQSVTRSVRQIPIGPHRAKGVMSVNRVLKGAFAAAWDVVRVSGPIGQLPAGVYLGFLEASYPELDQFLLVARKTDPDEQMVAWIPASRGSILTDGSAEYPLSEWNILGAAVSLGWGQGEDVGNTLTLAKGIGPHTRLP